MRKILLVPPASWGGDDTAALRAALNGTKAEISTGNHTDLIPGNDFVLIVLGDNYQPGLLRTVGESARANKVELVYATLPIAAVAAKISEIFDPKTREECP